MPRGYVVLAQLQAGFVCLSTPCCMACGILPVRGQPMPPPAIPWSFKRWTARVVLGSFEISKSLLKKGLLEHFIETLPSI